MNCTNCGKSLEASDRACLHCGAFNMSNPKNAYLKKLVGKNCGQKFASKKTDDVINKTEVRKCDSEVLLKSMKSSVAIGFFLMLIVIVAIVVLLATM